jgi:DNA-binding LacI/PurR family transcriptional regulator
MIKTNTTLDDIGKRAGVGKMTVSMILRDKPIRCKPETREKVLRVAKELNYQPSLAAKTLYSRKSDIIGLFTPRLGMEVNMIEKECSTAGFRLTASSFHNDPEILLNLLLDLRRRYAAGAVIIDPVGESKSLLKCQKEGLPLVLVVSDADLYPEIDACIDDTAGSVEAIIQHLISIGHRKIAGIFTSTETIPNSSAFWKGWQRGVSLIGEQPRKDWYFPIEYSLEEPEVGIYTSAYLAARNFVKKINKNDKDRPTAIFTMGDHVAVPVVKALQEGGWRVPQDISVVSNYVTEFGSYLPMPITGVSQDRVELRAGAARCLLERIKNKIIVREKPIRQLCEQQLVIRSSTLPTTSVERAEFIELKGRK